MRVKTDKSRSQAELLISLRGYLPACREALSAVPQDLISEGVSAMIANLQVFEVEILVELRDWESLAEAIKVCLPITLIDQELCP